jgi:hypothetical protein
MIVDRGDMHRTLVDLFRLFKKEIPMNKEAVIEEIETIEDEILETKED